MSTYKWRAEEEHLLKILKPTHSNAQIAMEINKRHKRNLPGFPCTRSTDAVRRKCLRDEITETSCASYTLTTNPYVDRWKQIFELQEKYKEESIMDSRNNNTKPVTKILSLADLHLPITKTDIVLSALEEHNDADIVVINGDLLEGFIFSTFEKHKSIAALDEYRSGFAFVQMLSSAFNHVVLIDGNHDVRVGRALKRAGFNKDATDVLRPNLLARMANGEELDQTGLLVQKHNFENVHYDSNESWYAKIGKTIFLHPSTRVSNKPGYTVERWSNYFNNRYQSHEIDSYVCAHTHRFYKGIINRQLLIEQPCLADLLIYAHSPKQCYAQNTVHGYAVIYQDADGNTDFNISGPIYTGELLPPKKEIIEL
jgi:UDP-2,3-diacylglucosamine pyrophosphatase LpxH